MNYSIRYDAIASHATHVVKMQRSNVSVVDKSLQQFDSLAGVIESVMQNATTVAEDLQVSKGKICTAFW